MHRDGPWLLDPAVVFLNHGSFGACPRPVLDAQRSWQEQLEREPVRFLWHDLPDRLATVRTRLGGFVRADPEGFAFVPNATAAVSTVLRSLEMAPGDEILTTDHEYNATLNALGETARRHGARVVTARIPFPIASPEEALAAVLDAVTRRTRLALISHVTSPTALVLPIGEIVRELEARGVDTLVDAAHAPGMVDVNVDDLAPAFWTGNGHKWLCGPKGSAVLWVRADRRGRVAPLVISHGWNDERVEEGAVTPFRARFDWTGTADPTPYLALGDAIDLVGGLRQGGWPAIMRANHELALEAGTALATSLGVPFPAPATMIGSMVALPLRGLVTDDDALSLHECLFRDGFEVPVHGWPVRAARQPGEPPRLVLLRISAQMYNERADYDALADALSRAGLGAPGGST